MGPLVLLAVPPGPGRGANPRPSKARLEVIGGHERAGVLEGGIPGTEDKAKGGGELTSVERSD